MYHVQPRPARRSLSPLTRQENAQGGVSDRRVLVAQVTLPLTLLEWGGGAETPQPARAMAVALLVDGENCSPDLVTAALAEADKYGPVLVRRVYGNQAVMGQRNWKEALSRHQLEAIHHERTAIGKNATDIALVVDAMDLLHRGDIGCFCLLASDSDYTPLVERLRAAERIVVGLGRAQTPASLTQACSVFIALIPTATPAVVSSAPPAAPVPRLSAASIVPEPVPRNLCTPAPPEAGAGIFPQRPVIAQETQSLSAAAPTQVATTFGRAADPGPLLLRAWAAVFQARGEVSLSNLVTEVQQHYPELRPEAYGHVRVAPLIKQRTDLFTIRQGKKDPSILLVERVTGSPALTRAHTEQRKEGNADAKEGLSGSSARGKVRELLLRAWQAGAKQGGWLPLSTFGVQLRLLEPAFEARAYGHAQLKSLIQAHADLFELRERVHGPWDVRLRSPARP